MAFWKKSSSTPDAGAAAPPAPAPASTTPAKPQVSLIDSKPAPAASASGGLMSSPAPAGAPTGASPAPQLSKEEMQRRAQVSKRLEQAFGEIASVLMRAPQYRQYTLADMEWLVVPPVLSGQFSLAEAQSKTSGFTAPIALVTWAKVSAEVDHRLAADPARQIRLKPEEWRSGEAFWVIDAVGDQKVLSALIKRLRTNEWAGKPVKIRARGEDGQARILTMDAMAKSAA